MPHSILFLCNPAMKSLALLESLPEDVNLAVTLDAGTAAAKAPDADVLVLNTDDQDLIRLAFTKAGKLQWVHSLMAGVEKKLIPEIRESAIPMTNARGVYAESLGEFALASCLYFAKDLKRMLRQQAEHRWQPFEVQEIAGATMVILGYGEIGRACARRASAMGMRVLGIRRRPELSEGDPYVENVVSFEQRAACIAEADYLVVAAPNTPDTKGLVGPAEIAAMKPTSVLINIGRGPVVDEAALVHALREGGIRGASLDVFDVEPLPAGHPFYDLENVLLSPHCADNTPGWLEDSMRFFLENYARFRAGDLLRNVVNKELGY
jgi:phosphoglycerate dehydrogenase-like enzyme